ncbi:MAG: ABC transporter permease [Deltaproteobacteria bacterium]|nr:ABC transporter permease [Deltaproteobacteria bacterium]
MQNFSTSPHAMAQSLWANRSLIRVLVVREVVGRYRGSVFGILWSFFNPVLMLAVYTFVFSVVFKARWGGGAAESKAEFALVLFAGLLVFNLFAECVIRAPSLILSNVNYVKKVVFPLEILPWVAFGAALFHAVVSFIVWVMFFIIIIGFPHPSVFLLPLVILPLVLVIMGISWFLAALGVFFRDVSQMVGVVVTILMFFTPIFYPLAAIPEAYRVFLFCNPLTFIVEQTRGLLIFGAFPRWGYLGLITSFSFLVAWFGFAWFQKTRKGFADVL